MMYESDSFFTLTVWGRLGLGVLSIVFALAAIGLTRVMTLRRPVVIRVPIWAFLFIMFVWASPQGYYIYYRLLFDGLPAQSVLGDMPPPQEIIALLTFRYQASLSAHAVGVLGWAMLITALWPQGKKCCDAAN
jgi:hypothetical protein